MDAQRARVLLLTVELAEAKLKVEQLSKRLSNEQSTLQQMCANKGHDYVEERLVDYHSSRNSYTCNNCGHFTMCRPSPKPSTHS